MLKTKEIKYFDYAATTFMCKAAIEAYVEYQKNVGVLWGKGDNRLSEESHKIFEESVDTIRQHFGINDEYKLIIGKNVTELVNIIAHSLKKIISPMDIILTGPYEHHSNYLPWKYLARETEAIFMEMPLRENGEINIEYLAETADKVKIVAFSSVSNVNGYQMPIEKLMEIFSEETMIFTDESQKVGHDKINLNKKITGYLLSSHKMYGPKNIAGAFLKVELIDKMAPFFLGGGMIYHQDYDDTWSEGVQKFYAGTYDVGLLAAWSAACKYIQEISYEKIKSREAKYFEKVKEELEKMSQVKIINGANSVKSLISFVNKKMHAHDVEKFLATGNYIIRSGNLCGQSALRKLGYNAVNRISFGAETDLEQVKELCNQLKNIDEEDNRDTSSRIKIIIPDDILVRSGIACGDEIIIQAELNEDILKFNYRSEACRHCELVLEYLYENYNGKPIDMVISELQSARTELDKNYETFCKKIFGRIDLRKSCVADTIKTSQEFFTNLKNNSYEYQKIEDTKSNLDCDACVSTGRVAWRNPDETLSRVKESDDKAETSSEYPKEFRKKWMRLSKVDLSREEIEELRAVVDEITYEEVMKFAKLKIEQMIFFNIKKYCGRKYKNPIWKNIYYRIYKKAVVENEVSRLKNYVKENKLKAIFVKGAYTSKLYKEDVGLRLFKDYDMVAFSAEEAFKIATFLFGNGFKIFYNEFSLKKIESKEEGVIYSGHFHLQKYVWGNYEIIIDINFPGFPLGRISQYRPERYSDTEISLEDEFIITLCHLFKHKDVFMKDLNDLFLILKRPLDYEYLGRQMDRYQLKFFGQTAVKYILENYKFESEKKRKLEIFFETEKTENKEWPYAYEDVYQVKREELSRRSKRYIDHDRIYLFPLVIFDRLLRIDAEIIMRIKIRPCKVEKADKQIYFLKYKDFGIMFCGMGIFWDNANDAEKCSREYLERELNILVELSGMREHVVYLPYYLKEKGKWFE